MDYAWKATVDPAPSDKTGFPNGRARMTTDSPTTANSTEASAARGTKAFGALGVRGYRMYLVTFALTMMADNVEHVISYWVAFQKFHSPALGGFAVVAHWLPFLVFSVAVGALITPKRGLAAHASSSRSVPRFRNSDRLNAGGTASL